MKNKMFLLLLTVVFLFPKDDLFHFKFDKLSVNIFSDKLQYIPGDTGVIAVQIKLNKGCYTYAYTKEKNMDKPATIEITNNDALSNAVIFKQIIYEAGKKKYDEIEKSYSYIYDDTAVFYIPFEIKKSANLGKYKIYFILNYIICVKEKCMFNENNFNFDIDVGKKSADSNNRDIFIKYYKK